MVDFRMPSLGADMEAGTLVEWLVKPGDRVKRGDVVAVVETQKGAIEIEVFENGTIEQILVDLDNKVPVGTPLARIRTEVEDKAGVAARGSHLLPVTRRWPRPYQARYRPPAGRSHRAPAPTVSGAGLRARASPAARRLARSQRHRSCHDDAAAVPLARSSTPTSSAYLVTTRAPGEKKRPTGLDLDAMRTAIAAAMARSKREIPHYYLQHQVDVTPCEQWLAQPNATRPPEARLLMGGARDQGGRARGAPLSAHSTASIATAPTKPHPPCMSGSRSPFAAAASRRRRCTIPTSSRSTS